jgi:hypothetical protein
VSRGGGGAQNAPSNKPAATEGRNPRGSEADPNVDDEADVSSNNAEEASRNDQSDHDSRQEEESSVQTTPKQVYVALRRACHNDTRGTVQDEVARTTDRGETAVHGDRDPAKPEPLTSRDKKVLMVPWHGDMDFRTRDIVARLPHDFPEEYCDIPSKAALWAFRMGKWHQLIPSPSLAPSIIKMRHVYGEQLAEAHLQIVLRECQDAFEEGQNAGNKQWMPMGPDAATVEATIAAARELEEATRATAATTGTKSECRVTPVGTPPTAQRQPILRQARPEPEADNELQSATTTGVTLEVNPSNAAMVANKALAVRVHLTSSS